MIRLLTLLSALCLLLTPALARAGAGPAERFYQNPARVRNIGDPFILPAEGSYWLFATTGGLAFQVRQSQDLVHWGKPAYAYAPGRDSWAGRDFWAPEVFEKDGRYYLFYSARDNKSGSLRVGLASAGRPQGPYEDVGKGPLFDFGYAAIDAHLFMEEGRAYLYYARDCSENVVDGRHESHIYGVRLKDDLSGVAGEPVLLTRPDQPWELRSGPEWLWNEGPSVVKHQGKYYLYYSANYFASRDYAVGVAVADDPLGPFVKYPEPLMSWRGQADRVLVSGPGHNSFFTVGGELFTAYHSHVYPKIPSGNRQLAIDRAGFLPDGRAYINGPTLAPQPLPLAQLGLRDHMRTARPEDEAARLLQDGDQQGAAARAAAYAFTWENPVTIDSLVLYARADKETAGQFSLGEELIRFTLPAGEGLPGQNLVIEAGGISAATMRLRWEGDAPPDCYELMAIGP